MKQALIIGSAILGQRKNIGGGRLTEYDNSHCRRGQGKPPTVYSPASVIPLVYSHGECESCHGDKDLVNGFCDICRAAGENERECQNTLLIHARSERARANSATSKWRKAPKADQ